MPGKTVLVTGSAGGTGAWGFADGEAARIVALP